MRLCGMTESLFCSLRRTAWHSALQAERPHMTERWTERYLSSLDFGMGDGKGSANRVIATTSTWERTQELCVCWGFSEVRGTDGADQTGAWSRWTKNLKPGR